MFHVGKKKSANDEPSRADNELC